MSPTGSRPVCVMPIPSWERSSLCPERKIQENRVSMYQFAVLDAVRLVGVLSQAALLVGLVVGEVALEPDTVLDSPSKARIWVTMRSRNQRSCEMMTAQPPKSSSASSSARRVSTSRSLVGSSSNSRLPPLFRSFARCTRLRSPPERSATRFCWSAPLKLKRPQ